MLETVSPEFEAEDLATDIELRKEVGKDSKAKQKYEARRRIDDLLEQKRLRQLLDDWEVED
ncbi:PA3496 family putative envelope integrity protein [Arsukibacterium sp. MJ3]|jgi:hypothetical protein|uniref:PA3496 family putative envelope integrity protein n=1 Tax=Arsukibacterium sp. MJ3 TaxID=1632859 RepID=UPI000A724C8F|nr:hypothetical protein [Arsukibacterium sp. MJ3]